MAIKINSLEIENVKRIRAVSLVPSETGLTIIGGNNGQGKTSVLDAIAWALGGEKYRPSKSKNTSSVTPPLLRIEMNNGLIVERSGKNSALKVTDPCGMKGGQQLLNEFVEELAINLPKFLRMTDKEKATTLLQIIGVSDQLAELDQQEALAYQERLYIGRTADQKKKFAEEQPYYPDAPDEPVSPSDLIRQQQEILARNGERARIRADALEAERQANAAEQALSMAYAAAAEAEKRLEAAKEAYNKAMERKEIAFNDAENAGEDELTDELEANIADIDAINTKVRANVTKKEAQKEADKYAAQYQNLTEKIGNIRQAKTALLDGADLPLPDLSVEDGELTYKGQRWDNMSGAEKLIVATAIVRKLNPQCGFVLLDSLEQLDMDTLHAFGEWLEAEQLQAIATRVSTGDECSIIIEDGMVAEQKPQSQKAVKKWEEEEF